jgi:hypothetical protein
MSVEPFIYTDYRSREELLRVDGCERIADADAIYESVMGTHPQKLPSVGCHRPSWRLAIQEIGG